MQSLTIWVSVFVSLLVAQCNAREWTDTKRNRMVEGELIDTRVTIRLPTGRTRTLEVDSLSDADRKFVIQQLQNQLLNPNPVNVAHPANAQAAQNNRNANRPLQSHTDFGSVKLSQDEIDKCIAAQTKDKPRMLDVFKIILGRKADNGDLTAAEIKKYQQVFDYLSKGSVLIVDRTPGSSRIFKPTVENIQYFTDSYKVTTVKVIDRNSAYVDIPNIGQHVILEGINTRLMPTGTWPTRLLLKDAGTKKVPGIVGDYDVRVYQAVSDEGFPKDIVIW